MNLGNGTCGPDGCLVMGTTDYGYFQFRVVTGSSVAIAGTLAYAIYAYAHRFITASSKR